MTRFKLIPNDYWRMAYIVTSISTPLKFTIISNISSVLENKQSNKDFSKKKNFSILIVMINKTLSMNFDWYAFRAPKGARYKNRHYVKPCLLPYSKYAPVSTTSSCNVSLLLSIGILSWSASLPVHSSHLLVIY